MAKRVVVDGIEFKTATEAARAIWNDDSNNLTVTEIAKKIGVSIPCVHIAVKSGDKHRERLNRYRVIRLGKTGKYSASMIAHRCNMKTNVVVALMKKAGIKLPTKDELDKAAKATKPKKAKNVKKNSKKQENIETVKNQIDDSVANVSEEVISEEVAVV